MNYFPKRNRKLLKGIRIEFEKYLDKQELGDRLVQVLRRKARNILIRKKYEKITIRMNHSEEASEKKSFIEKNVEYFTWISWSRVWSWSCNEK